MHLEQAIPDFKRRNFECFISENNRSVSNAMEELEVEIIKFEHTWLSFFIFCLFLNFLLGLELIISHFFSYIFFS